MVPPQDLAHLLEKAKADSDDAVNLMTPFHIYSLLDSLTAGDVGLLGQSLSGATD